MRTLLLPNWDIHPEMVTHTRVIDLRTGHPFPEISPKFMENWDWTDGRSVDELASYLAYALRILREVGLPCEGITTPGGFGNEVLPELAQATLQACRDVYRTEIPHYFRHLYDEGERSVAPRVEYASQLDSPDPRCVVSIIGCTGDWTGNWDCSTQPEPDRFITPDLQTGRLVDVIQRGEPAILVCHWTGIYYNGEARGFRAFQEVVRRLHARFDNLLWMKTSEIARYWAAKELTRVQQADGRVELQAPYACPRFTLRIAAAPTSRPTLGTGDTTLPLTEVVRPTDLDAGTFVRQENATVVCFDLPRGRSTVQL